MEESSQLYKILVNSEQSLSSRVERDSLVEVSEKVKNLQILNSNLSLSRDPTFDRKTPRFNISHLNNESKVD